MRQHNSTPWTSVSYLILFLTLLFNLDTYIYISRARENQYYIIVLAQDVAV